jgi:acylaminoacyl-peptidase
MVYMALRDGFPAKAAAVWGAFTDLEPLVASGPLAKAGAAIWPQYENDRETLYRTRSAMRFADRLTTPILIMHGGADDDIPISQSQRMDAELTRLGARHKFIVFEGEKHVIGGRGAERDAATIAWFQGK